MLARPRPKSSTIWLTLGQAFRNSGNIRSTPPQPWSECDKLGATLAKLGPIPATIDPSFIEQGVNSPHIGHVQPCLAPGFDQLGDKLDLLCPDFGQVGLALCWTIWGDALGHQRQTMMPPERGLTNVA